MEMHRFFLPRDCFDKDTVVITGRPVHHLRNVLRLRPGDRVIALDDSGWEYEVELRTLGVDEIKGIIEGRSPAAGEPRTRITIYQALLKGSSFERVLQKCTEVGVAGFVPVICERCVLGESGGRRGERWKRIILEAAQQSRRGRLPLLSPAASFEDACRLPRGISLLPWEGEDVGGIGSVLRGFSGASSFTEVSIFIGPEGGFSDVEVDFARSRGVTTVSMGRRILRAETAGLVATAITLYELGELGG